MSIMGIGTNILGYGHLEVDEAVHKIIETGNMATFNCSEEVLLSEKLLELHPWADMVRLARAGGEINSMAVRIARASTGKDKIAICGYHGWHDWYLSTNLNNDKNLDGHLLPGLQTDGVPRGLIGTTLPFNYNDIDQLEALIKDNKDEKFVYGFLCLDDPYEATKDERLRAKWIEEAKLLYGEFRPAGP